MSAACGKSRTTSNTDLSDAETRTIIDKLAEFVARNGPDFETVTKKKQLVNPKFSFLYGGAHYNYYKYRVCMEQQRSKALFYTQSLVLTRSSHFSVEPTIPTGSGSPKLG